MEVYGFLATIFVFIFRTVSRIRCRPWVRVSRVTKWDQVVRRDLKTDPTTSFCCSAASSLLHSLDGSGSRLRVRLSSPDLLLGEGSDDLDPWPPLPRLRSGRP